jgi:hypothetical protein
VPQALSYVGPRLPADARSLRAAAEASADSVDHSPVEILLYLATLPDAARPAAVPPSVLAFVSSSLKIVAERLAAYKHTQEQTSLSLQYAWAIVRLSQWLHVVVDRAVLDAARHCADVIIKAEEPSSQANTEALLLLSQTLMAFAITQPAAPTTTASVTPGKKKSSKVPKEKTVSPAALVAVTTELLLQYPDSLHVVKAAHRCAISCLPLSLSLSPFLSPLSVFWLSF